MVKPTTVLLNYRLVVALRISDVWSNNSVRILARADSSWTSIYSRFTTYMFLDYFVDANVKEGFTWQLSSYSVEDALLRMRFSIVQSIIIYFRISLFPWFGYVSRCVLLRILGTCHTGTPVRHSIWFEQSNFKLCTIPLLELQQGIFHMEKPLCQFWSLLVALTSSFRQS